MKEENLNNYQTPTVEVIEVSVEQGFVVSPGGSGSDMDWDD